VAAHTALWCVNASLLATLHPILLCISGVEHLGLRRIVAKIGLANEPSRKLFRSLGFVHESTADIFQEETLALAIPADGALPAACQALETVVSTAAAPDHVRADP